MAEMTEHTEPDLPVASPQDPMVQRVCPTPLMHLQYLIPLAGVE